jgi:hypothetical protein
LQLEKADLETQHVTIFTNDVVCKDHKKAPVIRYNTSKERAEILKAVGNLTGKRVNYLIFFIAIKLNINAFSSLWLNSWLRTRRI